MCAFKRLTRRRVPRTPGRYKAVKAGYGPNWRRQKAAALERDAYKCKYCGSTWRVAVHHKRKISLFYDATTDLMDFEAANSLDNLITLCPACHRVADGHSSPKGFVLFRR